MSSHGVDVISIDVSINVDVSFSSASFNVHKRPCLLVDPWLLEVDRSVHLHVLTVHDLPCWSLDALVNGLTSGTPVLFHERWPPYLLSPTFVVSTKVRSILVPSLRSGSSSAPSRTTASGKS